TIECIAIPSCFDGSSECRLVCSADQVGFQPCSVCNAVEIACHRCAAPPAYVLRMALIVSTKGEREKVNGQTRLLRPRRHRLLVRAGHVTPNVCTTRSFAASGRAGGCAPECRA